MTKIAWSALAIALACGGVASAQETTTALETAVAPPHRTSTTNSDPWQPLNRRFYGMSRWFDRIAFRPVAMTYRRWIPRPLRNGASRVLSNLDEPVITVNFLLQGRVTHSTKSALRFVTNSTLGVAGIFDPARSFGLSKEETDFGVTMGRLHIGAGPYVFIPLLGPSSLRDAIGAGVDLAIDPLSWIQFRGANALYVSETVLGVLDARVEAEPNLQTLDLTSVDPYASLRSYYLQSRTAEIHGPAPLEDLPDFPDAAPEPPLDAASIAPSP